MSRNFLGGQGKFVEVKGRPKGFSRNLWGRGLGDFSKWPPKGFRVFQCFSLGFGRICLLFGTRKWFFLLSYNDDRDIYIYWLDWCRRWEIDSAMTASEKNGSRSDLTTMIPEKLSTCKMASSGKTFSRCNIIASKTFILDLFDTC